MNNIYPVIFCIAKMEEDYIEEFVKYHLGLGFKHIYLYDNEDEPTYHKILKDYLNEMTIIHIPKNEYNMAVQYVVINHFIDNILDTSDKITHVIHMDIDEFIVLKRHKNICEFIEEYIKDDCKGIGINWRFFGSSGQIKQTKEPVTQRFILCQEKADKHIKTLYKRDNIICYGTCHDVIVSKGVIKSTNNKIIYGAFNEDYDVSVIQLNHYKTKTWEEFKRISKRGRADKTEIDNMILETRLDKTIEKSFNTFNLNETEDTTARDFYKSIIENKNDKNK